jgi:uncharacterized repeat protein (TIGR01451 family)
VKYLAVPLVLLLVALPFAHADFTDIDITDSTREFQVLGGDTLFYDVFVFNEGTTTVDNIVAENQLHKDVLFRGATVLGSASTPGDYNKNTGLWQVGTLEPGEWAYLEIEGKLKNNSKEFIIKNEACLVDQPDKCDRALFFVLPKELPTHPNK